MNETDLRIDVHRQAGGRCDWSMRITHIPTGIVEDSGTIPGRGISGDWDSPGARSQLSVKAELLERLHQRLDERNEQ